MESIANFFNTSIPLWLMLLISFFTAFIGLAAMSIIASGRMSDVELEAIAEKEKSFNEYLRLKKRNLELREKYSVLKSRFIKLDKKYIKLLDEREISEGSFGDEQELSGAN